MSLYKATHRQQTETSKQTNKQLKAEYLWWLRCLVMKINPRLT